MDVTLNLQVDLSKALGVQSQLGQIDAISSVDAGLLHHGLLVVHVERRDVTRVQEALGLIDGVVCIRLGQVAHGA